MGVELEGAFVTSFETLARGLAVAKTFLQKIKPGTAQASCSIDWKEKDGSLIPTHPHATKCTINEETSSTIILNQEFALPKITDSKAAFIINAVQILVFIAIAAELESKDVDISRVRACSIFFPSDIGLDGNGKPTALMLHFLTKALADKFGPGHPALDDRYAAWHTLAKTYGEKYYDKCIKLNLCFNAYHNLADGRKSFGNKAMWDWAQSFYMQLLVTLQDLLGIIVPQSVTVRNKLTETRQFEKVMFGFGNIQAYHPCTIYTAKYYTEQGFILWDKYCTCVGKERFDPSFEEVTIGFVSMNDPYNCILLQLRKDAMGQALSLAHKLIRSAWDIYNGKVKGTLTAAQLRYIEGSLKGMGLSKRRAEAAQLIRDGHVGEVTEKEMEENKNSVASGKKGAHKNNYNSWAIKSTEENKVLKHEGQEACEFELSTRGVFNFLKASNVKTSKDTVLTSMNAKINDGTSGCYSELFLGAKKKPSGILVKLLSSIKNGKIIKV
jgi:hypothetical protein